MKRNESCNASPTMPDDQIDTRRLRMFLSTYDLGSMRVASRSLSLTPSALSHGIKSLEEMLGVTLFERHNNRLVPTNTARSFYREVSTLLAQFDKTLAAYRGNRHQRHAQLKLGADSTACRYLLPAVIREFKESFPHMAIKLHVLDANELVEPVATGRLDLAIAPLQEDYQELNQTELGADDLMFVVNPRHPWVQPGATAADRNLQNERLILNEAGSPTHALIEAYFRKQRIPLSPFIELNDEEAIKELVALDIGIGILPGWIVRRETEQGKLRALPLGRRKLRRRWVIFHRHGTQPDFPETLFTGICGAVARNLLGQTPAGIALGATS